MPLIEEQNTALNKNVRRQRRMKWILPVMAILAMATPAEAQRRRAAPVSATPPAPAAPATTLLGYDLPEISYPEGVAYEPATGVFYTASAKDGTVMRYDTRTRTPLIVAKPGLLVPVGETAFPTILGMKVDSGGYLWIAGGRTGKMFVLDPRTGVRIKAFTISEPGSLINDVVVTAKAAYFTDTLKPVLWRVPIEPGVIGELEPYIDLTAAGLPYAEGPNLNGIAATPDGKTLIVGQMNLGRLYRIDTETKQTAYIDLAGETVAGADGLVLDGTTLYVVRQPNAEIVTIQLTPDFTSGKVVRRFTEPGLLWPATAAKAGNHLLVVNSQFNKREANAAVFPFNIVQLPLGLLSAVPPPAAVVPPPLPQTATGAATAAVNPPAPASDQIITLPGSPNR